MWHYGWICTHRGEAVIVTVLFCFDVTISQQVAARFSPANSEQLNNLKGKENALRDFVTSVGQTLPYFLGPRQAAEHKP